MEVDPVVLVTEAAPDAAEQGSQALEEEWDDEVFEALEHAAKNAATGWWNSRASKKAVATLLARKPTWEQALDWILDEARRFPTPLGPSSGQKPFGRGAQQKPDLLPIYTEGALTVEMPETSLFCWGCSTR